MELRLIEAYIPKGLEEKLLESLDDDKYIWLRFHDIDNNDNFVLVRVLTTIKWDEEVIDRITSLYSVYEGFELVVFQPKTAEPLHNKKEHRKRLGPIPRISRQELYVSMFSKATLSFSNILMVILSAIVAGIGLYKNDPAVIIGAMVMAPFLGPNMALGLGVTLADTRLIFESIKTLFVMLIVAFVLGIIMGWSLPVNPNIPQIASRTDVDILAVIVALASGAAGTLSAITGEMASLVGVMVAVALLPPFMVFSMLLGAGYFSSAFGALMLFFANIIGVNLASVTLFNIYGITPMTWWDKRKAQILSAAAYGLWFLLLLFLITIIYSV
ncbi:TIGR00341 family protein [bacterium 3DAC]|nr:TIGR00341 family protein [Dictyoglomota bacterium]UZN22871.1 TIGR00341 family protein [bacterium 3DAC]